MRKSTAVLGNLKFESAQNMCCCTCRPAATVQLACKPSETLQSRQLLPFRLGPGDPKCITPCQNVKSVLPDSVALAKVQQPLCSSCGASVPTDSFTTLRPATRRLMINLSCPYILCVRPFYKACHRLLVIIRVYA